MDTSVQNSREDVICRQLAKTYGLPLQHVERLKKAFVMWDADKNDYLDENEFGTMIQSLCSNLGSIILSSTRLAEYWSQCDTDKDGRISFTEFTRWFSSKAELPIFLKNTWNSNMEKRNRETRRRSL